MFREMRRSKQAVSEAVCLQILKTARRGVLSVMGDDGYPYGVPINFVFDEDDGKLYFHSAKEGHKLDALRRCSKVSFTTWDDGYRKDGDWAWYVTSVIAFGQVSFVSDAMLAEDKLRKLGLKYYPTAEEAEHVLAKHGSRVQMLAMTIDHCTGKLVHEK